MKGQNKMTNSTFKVGDRVRIKAGIPYTQAMQGHIFTVVKIQNKFTFNTMIANENTPTKGITFNHKSLERA